MASPWERIENDDFRGWLTEAGTDAEDYNGVTLVQRMELLDNFKRGQQQQLHLQQQLEDKLNFLFARAVKKEEEEATLQLSKPNTKKYASAVQKIGVRIDAPIWENSTLEDGFNRTSK